MEYFKECWHIPYKFTGTANVPLEWNVNKRGVAKFVNGKYHCDNGPAVITEDGYSYYFINGKYHRTDGPCVFGNGLSWFAIKGKLMSEENFCVEVNKLNQNKVFLNLAEVPKDFYGKAFIHEKAGICYFKKAVLHRTEFPAIIVNKTPQNNNRDLGHDGFAGYLLCLLVYLIASQNPIWALMAWILLTPLAVKFSKIKLKESKNQWFYEGKEYNK